MSARHFPNDLDHAMLLEQFNLPLRDRLAVFKAWLPLPFLPPADVAELSAVIGEAYPQIVEQLVRRLMQDVQERDATRHQFCGTSSIENRSH